MFGDPFATSVGIIAFYHFSTVCYTGHIRLLGGQSAAEGTMELCSLNTWAATCGEYFSVDDATVICRQLGFNSSETDRFEINNAHSFVPMYRHC